MFYFSCWRNQRDERYAKEGYLYSQDWITGRFQSRRHHIDTIHRKEWQQDWLQGLGKCIPEVSRKTVSSSLVLHGFKIWHSLFKENTYSYINVFFCTHSLGAPVHSTASTNVSNGYNNTFYFITVNSFYNGVKVSLKAVCFHWKRGPCFS